MTIISSQHDLVWDIVERKMDELTASGATSVTVPCWYIGEIDGVQYAIQSDGHHTLQAARDLGIAVEYQMDDDPEGLSGEDALEARWMDGDWYYVETSNPGEGKMDLVWQ